MLHQQAVVNEMRLRISHMTFVLSTCIKRRIETYNMWKESEKAVGAAWGMFSAAENEYNEALTRLEELKQRQFGITG